MVDTIEKRYTDEEFMKMMKVKSRLTPYRWRKKGLLGYYKIGPTIYYGESHIREFLARCNHRGKERVS